MFHPPPRRIHYYRTPSGERIQVAVVSQKGNPVRVGIDAPADAVILPEEVTDRRLSSG